MTPASLDPTAVWNVARPTLLFIAPLVVAAGVLQSLLKRCPPAWRDLPLPRSSVWLVGLATATLYTGIGLYVTASIGEHSGDEGHYLLLAESIYRDRDLDIRNNLGNPPETQRLKFHVSPASRAGRWYSWHPFGLSLMLAPTVPLGITARHAVLGACSGLALAAVTALCRMLGARLLWSALVLLLFGFSSLWGIYSSRALPEVAGAALAGWMVVGLLAQPSRPWAAALLVAGCAAGLPWLHTRLIPLSVVGGAWYLNGALGSPGSPRRRALVAVPALLCLTAGAGYVLLHFSLFEGGSGYPAKDLITAPRAHGMWHALGSSIGVLGSLPLFAWLLPAAVLLAARDPERRRAAAVALTMVLGALLPSTTRWASIGARAAGLYLVAVAPLLLPFAALALARARALARAWFLLLGLLSCAHFALLLLRLPLFGKSFVGRRGALEVVYPLFKGLLHPLLSPAASDWHAFALLLYLVSTLVLLGVPSRRRSPPA